MGKYSEAIKQLEALESGDPERAHIEAEDIICNYLKEIGATEIVEAYDEARERVGFWYA